MIAIDADLMAFVFGGETSGTTVQVAGARYSTARSDYQTCVDTVTQLTREQYPDTRWFGLFGTDRNARRRADATLGNLREVCGPPPQ